jgi:hypothetical protein
MRSPLIPRFRIPGEETDSQHKKQVYEERVTISMIRREDRKLYFMQKMRLGIARYFYRFNIRQLSRATTDYESPQSAVPPSTGTEPSSKLLRDLQTSVAHRAIYSQTTQYLKVELY